MVVFDETKQDKRVTELLKKEEEDLARYLSQKYGIEYLDLTAAPVNTDALRVMTEAEAREGNIGPFNLIGKRLKLGVLAPKNDKTIAAIKALEEKGYICELFMTSHDGLDKVWSRYKDLSFSFETKAGALDISNDEIIELVKKVKTIDDVKGMVQNILSLKKSARVSRILEMIMAGAVALNASDVHLEPEEAYVRLRYRLDGVLTDVLHFDIETYALLLSRVKLLSGLKLNLKGAQDGRFSVKIGEDDIEIRTSVLPGAYSGSLVLRILNPKGIQVPMEELGFEPHLLEVLEHEIKRPNGMILTTGPTGSGKTTTLYAFLRKIHTPDIKIITIENPIEYHLPGIVQTQTDPEKKYTFAKGLRSALRQDPDVIMVGEIRDEETAEIAVNSALTGHLVFSTLHTNNAAGAFPRLIDLGVNPKVITSAINITMAQRLVRKLCPHCRKAMPYEGFQKKIVDETLASIYNKALVPTERITYEAAGCEKCNMTGFIGRIGIHEAIITSEKIEKIVINDPSEREIKKAAYDQGLLDMKQDGVIKVLRGVTSISELGRVIDLEEEGFSTIDH